MKIQTALFASAALAGFAFVAHAGEDQGARCLEASTQGELEKIVDECSKAVKADPLNERAREALENARAELVQAERADHPAKLNQR